MSCARSYSDGVSYWDKQGQIHQGTHNHGDNSFIPWHRGTVQPIRAAPSTSFPGSALLATRCSRSVRITCDARSSAARLRGAWEEHAMGGALPRSWPLVGLRVTESTAAQRPLDGSTSGVGGDFERSGLAKRPTPDPRSGA
jgi:hypothetical protein